MRSRVTSFPYPIWLSSRWTVFKGVLRIRFTGNCLCHLWFFTLKTSAYLYYPHWHNWSLIWKLWETFTSYRGSNRYTGGISRFGLKFKKWKLWCKQITSSESRHLKRIWEALFCLIEMQNKHLRSIFLISATLKTAGWEFCLGGLHEWLTW